MYLDIELIPFTYNGKSYTADCEIAVNMYDVTDSGSVDDFTINSDITLFDEDGEETILPVNDYIKTKAGLKIEPTEVAKQLKAVIWDLKADAIQEKFNEGEYA